MDQTMTVQTQAPQQQSLRKMLGMGQGQAAGDAFAMIFQQMMDGEEMDGRIVEMLAQLFGALQDDSEEMGTQMAAEMLAAMPGLAPQDLFAMMQNSGTMPSGVADILAASLNTPQSRAQLPMILAQAERAGVLQEQPEELSGEGLPQADKDFLQVLKSAWTEEPRPAAPAMTLDHSAIRAARELLAKSRRDQNTEALDVESLQADVNARRFMPAEGVGKQELPVPDAEEIARQLKSSILDNVARGQNEFLVKLKPEGIGEILVKFSENKDKITLSIFTNDAQTARLISGEVAALQNALKPLNAEVQEITTVAANEQAAQYSAQNQMTDQGRQFFGQQTSRDSHSGNPRGGVEAIQEDSFDDTVEAGLVTDDALDTYI